MNLYRLRFALALPLLALTLAACQAEPDEGVTLEALGEQTHFHGIAVDRQDPERILLATHHGFYVVGPDGLAHRVSEEMHDFMGFTPHSTEPGKFFASGHPARGGNLGVVVSTDGGRSWQQRSPGVDGPVDFHQLTVSEADPDVLYGAYRDRLQLSRDGGHTWQIRSPAPEGLIALAASARDPDRLYAATRTGLLMSSDGGQRWRHVHLERRPVSVVAASGGDVYAFMLGIGLIRAEEGRHDWEVVSGDWGEGFLMHLAVDPGNPERLVATDDQTRVLVSHNGGRDWSAL